MPDIKILREIRILPPLGIARLGSSKVPMDNYTFSTYVPSDKYRKIIGAETLVVENGIVTHVNIPNKVRFKDNSGNVKPIAPFFEIWAIFDDNEVLEPLTLEHLKQLGITADAITWRVHVANLKAYRRTGNINDKVEVATEDFSDNKLRNLLGKSNHFKDGKFIPFGTVQYISPTVDFPEIRLRFTPAAGKVYGPKPKSEDPNVADDVYNAIKGGWDNHADGDASTPLSTIPGNIYFGDENSQAGRYISHGYLDDTCDGIIEAKITVQDQTLTSFARVTVGPPDFAPDSFPLRTVADELEQIIYGPEVVSPVKPSEVVDVMRRVVETVRLINTEVMNGNNNVGDGTENRNNMARHDARSYGRVLEPIFMESIVEPSLVHGFHQSALEDLENGTKPWFFDKLRKYNEVGNLTNSGRRKMPGMMRGSDGMHLALTRRQINKFNALSDEPRT